MRVASAFPPVARQWHEGRRSPLTVAGAAAALRHRQGFLAPRSLFTRRHPESRQRDRHAPTIEAAQAELSTDYEGSEFDLACMLARRPRSRFAPRPLRSRTRARERREVEQQRLAAHGDEIERAGEQRGPAAANSARRTPPGSSCRAASALAEIGLRLHRPHAGWAASRATGRSWIGQCTAAANRPSAIEIHHIIS